MSRLDGKGDTEKGKMEKNNYRKPQYTNVSDLGYSYCNDNKSTNNDSNVSKG